VLAVMLFHARLPWMPGGYLGVEVFFGISGFLITMLLLREWEQAGRIDFRRFWMRRLKRLYPALLMLLLVATLLGGFLLGPRAAQFRLDLLASSCSFENWYQILSGGSYFAVQGLPLCRHLWSLAVENQFYLVWPLLVAGLLSIPRFGRRALAWGTALLALGSFGLMLHLADPGNPSSARAAESLNRAYLGTDTRAFGILTGALLAMAPTRGSAGRLWRWGLDLAALAALAGLAMLCARLDIKDALLYRGGLLLVDGMTIVIIAALTQPCRGFTRALLGSRPMEWVGRRSYSLFLWHWPIFKWVGQGQSGPAWLLIRFALSLVIAEASYRWVEIPWRDGVFRRWLAPAPLRRRMLALAAGSLVVGVSIRAGVVIARQPAYLDEVQESLKVNARALDRAAAPSAPAPAAPTAPLAAALPPLAETSGQALEGLTITAIGDSVMKGAAIALKAAGETRLGDGAILINAEESRPFGQSLEIVEAYKKEGRLGEVVVIHLGTNNSNIQKAQFNRLAEILADRRLVLFVTAKSDNQAACDAVNATLAHLVDGMANACLFDWQAVAADRPELFYTDQTHLRPPGARFYATALLNQIDVRMEQVKAVAKAATP